MKKGFLIKLDYKTNTLHEVKLHLNRDIFKDSTKDLTTIISITLGYDDNAKVHAIILEFLHKFLHFTKFNYVAYISRNIHERLTWFPKECMFRYQS